MSTSKPSKTMRLVLHRLRDPRVDDLDSAARPGTVAPHKARYVLQKRLGALLERHDNAALAVLLRSLGEHLHAEDALSCAGAAKDHRDSAARETSVGDVVEAVYPRAHLAAWQEPLLSLAAPF
jgi:hypothetical protein